MMKLSKLPEFGPIIKELPLGETRLDCSFTFKNQPNVTSDSKLTINNLEEIELQFTKIKNCY